MRLKNMRIVLSASLFAGMIWLACAMRAGNKPKEAGKPLPVRTAPIIRESIRVPIHSAGLLSAKAEIELAFKVGGVISRVAIDEGQVVQRGQLLAELDLEEMQAQLSQAESAHAKAERDVARLRNLYADSVVTLEQLQNAETALQAARARLRLAKFNAVHARITAPSTGKILRRYADANEIVSPGTPVFRFASAEQAYVVRIGVVDRDLIRLALNDSASVFFDVYPEQPFVGSVVEIGEIADPATGTFEVEIRLQPDDRRLASGFFARVDIFPRSAQPYAVIPIEALSLADGDRGVVFTPDPDGKRAIRRQVRIAHLLDDRAAIAVGLDNAVSVITDGAQFLRADQPILIFNQ